MKFDFHGKTILVTGGCTGIGLSISKMYLSLGGFVISTYNDSEKEGELLKEYILKENFKGEVLKLNLESICDIENFLENLKEKNLNNIDILINNSGIDDINPLIFQEDEKILSMININFSNTIIFTKYILKDFMEENSCIINISSIWGRVGASCEVVYSSTKGGINLFTKSLAKEMECKNIKVIGVSPGIINTKINSHLSQEELEEIKKEIPLGRIGEVKDITNAIMFLSSDYFNVSGEIINIDGGWMM